MADGLSFEQILRRVVREELARALPQRRADPTLAPFLAACWAFSGGKAWTAAELLDDAAYGRVGDLLDALAAIHGDRGDPAKRLGRWLERHAGAEADGLRLVRVKREAGAWLYAVTKV
ncbi:MAG: hypothetical protein IPN24_14665 [Betaproteobacteria bacterium]|nr:hypothetical protein [Betaproteobacteria bacterium]